MYHSFPNSALVGDGGRLGGGGGGGGCGRWLVKGVDYGYSFIVILILISG